MIDLIYKDIDPSRVSTIEQGDIFRNLPSLDYETFLDGFSDYSKNLEKKIANVSETTIYLQPVNGVLLTQTCDARPDSILVFSSLDDVPEDKFPTLNDEMSNAKLDTRQKYIKKVIRDQTRYHFFTEDVNIEFFNKAKKCDFSNLFFIPYDHLVQNLNLYFCARLKSEAITILKEKIGRFFMRLAFEDSMFFSNPLIKRILAKKDEVEKELIISTLKQMGRDISTLE